MPILLLRFVVWNSDLCGILALIALLREFSLLLIGFRSTRLRRIANLLAVRSGIFGRLCYVRSLRCVVLLLYPLK